MNNLRKHSYKFGNTQIGRHDEKIKCLGRGLCKEILEQN